MQINQNKTIQHFVAPHINLYQTTWREAHGEVVEETGFPTNGHHTLTTDCGTPHNSQPIHTEKHRTTSPIYSVTNNKKLSIDDIRTKSDKERPNNPKPNEKTNITLESYNCHGFSRTADYVLERLETCDIMGLTETWFRPNELHTIENAIKSHPTFQNNCKNFLIYSKSGMQDTDADYSGRPYGGVSVVVKPNRYYTCKEIENLSERIVSIGLYDNENNLTRVICCVYMPYYNGKSDQLELYIETLDMLQAIIDQYASIAPIKIIGDLNTKLPTSHKLIKNWHRHDNFNVYSNILYDFLCYNGLIAADLIGKQPINYTYFCHENETYSWIDHILCGKHNISDVLS